MDLKLWEYIFEMFNYKIRQKKLIFSKLQTLSPSLNNFLNRKKNSRRFNEQLYKNNYTSYYHSHR